MIIRFLKKLLSSFVMLILLSLFLFFLLRLAPGGPFDGEKNLPEVVMQTIKANYGLDRPVYEQYFIWANQLLHGNFGESFQYIGTEVIDLVLEAMKPSFILGFFSFLFSFVFGISLGVLSSVYEGKKCDQFLLFFSQSAQSIPIYLVASLLILFFSLKLNLLPPALWEGPESAILPILTLSCRPLFLIYSLTRTEMQKELKKDYIRTAKAKGMKNFKVYFKHALRNASIPVLSYSGSIFANLLTGSFLVELVFQIPGLGKYFVSSVMNRDYPLVMFISLFYGVILISLNLLTEILIEIVDPRVHLGSE